VKAAESALVCKLNRFMQLDQADLAGVARLGSRRRSVPAGTELVHERQENHPAFIVEDG
jgi:hypothetical protein